MKKTLALLVFIFVSYITFAQSQYFIVFKANPATSLIAPGHAFASLVKKDASLNQTIVELTLGFHPVDKSPKALFSTKGEVELTEIGDLGKSDFVVEVDQITYEYSKKLKERWDKKKYGILANQNCVDFVKQLAELVIPDLDLPSPVYQYPKPFLDVLRGLNTKRDADSRLSLSKLVNNTNFKESVSHNSNVIPDKNIITPKPQDNPVPQKTTNSLGAANPEALGVLLLNALKNNDKTTWIRCIHPKQEQQFAKRIEDGFESIKRDLYDDGLTDWKQVQFSRVTYNRHNDDNKIVLGDFTIEFRYKKDEYIGTVKFWSVATISKTSEKYFVWGVPVNYGAELRRNFFR